jgi:hypothetical protein
VDAKRHEVRVLLHGSEYDGVLTETVDGAAFRLNLEAAERSWSGDGPDLFAALRTLLGSLESIPDARLGVNGARPNAWASGMLRDMAGGQQVYLLSLPRIRERPPTAPTLGDASLSEVGSLAEQDAFQANWRQPPSG